MERARARDLATRAREFGINAEAIKPSGHDPTDPDYTRDYGCLLWTVRFPDGAEFVDFGDGQSYIHRYLRERGE